MELPKSVLIVPMQPTPNGRLHVGHGAGPYLRADVLARALRVAGHQVAVISGSDAFENWVIADALSSGRTPARPATTSTPAFSATCRTSASSWTTGSIHGPKSTIPATGEFMSRYSQNSSPAASRSSTRNACPSRSRPAGR
jgi:hypothetical protein